MIIIRYVIEAYLLTKHSLVIVCNSSAFLNVLQVFWKIYIFKDAQAQNLKQTGPNNSEK